MTLIIIEPQTSLLRLLKVRKMLSMALAILKSSKMLQNTVVKVRNGFREKQCKAT